MFCEPKFRRVDVGDKGGSSFYGLDESMGKKNVTLIVRCNGHNAYYIDLTKNGQLAILYDGWFLFLEKVKSNSR